MMRHDQPRYIVTARRRIEDLQQMMLIDSSDEGDGKDANWVTDSIRREFGGVSASVIHLMSPLSQEAREEEFRHYLTIHNADQPDSGSVAFGGTFTTSS